MAHNLQRRWIMQKAILSILVAIPLSFAATSCDQDDHEHSGHEAMPHAMGEPASAAHHSDTEHAHAGQRTVPVTVDDQGFTPSHIEVHKGADTTLVFTRTSDSTCAKKVVFPELELAKELPLNQALAVNVPASEARTLTFQCGMGMYKSSVVIN